MKTFDRVRHDSRSTSVGSTIQALFDNFSGLKEAAEDGPHAVQGPLWRCEKTVRSVRASDSPRERPAYCK